MAKIPLLCTDGAPVIRFRVFNTVRRGGIGVRTVQALGRIFARLYAPGDWDGGIISVVVVGDAEIARLNARFLGRGGPTDVLAFPLDDRTPSGSPRVIGDVVVNAEQAERVARQRCGMGRCSPLRQASRAELALYIVHGLLHLAGYDDHSPAQRRRMYAAERKVFQAAGWDYVR